ncbi:MAG: threonine synthase [Candidatus Marinimicrobia bacterium]|nr:threonine synthase [Candidatus Neomarinimicrobiota bacterium]
MNNLDVIYNYDWIRAHWSKQELTNDRDDSLWRYLPLLPVKTAPENHSIRVGGTPLISFPKIALDYDLNNFYIKDDMRNPSGSLKDRATEIGIQHASELGKDTLVAASTGNAAASLSALSAFYGKKAVILAPASTPKAKLTQILQHGAHLYLIDGSYDEAFDLSIKVAKEFGWYLRSTGINPIMSEGKKTVALEISEQLDWQVPDKVFVPVGDGCIIGGIYKGFYDLKQLDWIDKIPKLIALQAEGSAAIVNALENNGEIKLVSSNTLADSISVDFPRDGLKALRAVNESGGFGIKITDDEILKAQLLLSKTTGIFAEPAAAAAFGGFLKAHKSGKIETGESVIVLITGTGLKDVPSAQKQIKMPEAISPDFSLFRDSHLTYIK